MINVCVIQGRFVRDPELKTTDAGLNISNFTLACDDDYAKDGKRETVFIDFVCFRKTAEFVCKHFKKGDMAVVKGKLSVRSYTDKEGIKRKTSEIVVDSINFGGSKRDRQEDNESGYTGFVPNSMTPGAFAELDDDDAQLPF